jgi:beta-N-acetylhexosaminidase
MDVMTKAAPLTLLLLSLSGTTLSHADESLRQKIGQMFIMGFDGTTIGDSIRADLAERNLGGVILMGYNCSSPVQIQNLASSIRSAAHTVPFIAVDEEGGLVARLNQGNGFGSTFTEYQLGTVFHSTDSTAHQASRMAGWLSSSGFTTDFAPVVDVNVNPLSPAIGYYGRSFSKDPQTVAQHSQVFVDQFHARGVMTTLKHFPGHGSATTDSHLQLPDITATWADSELIPYRSLIASNRVDIVMIAHLYDAHIDSVYPTSLSYRTVTGLLRDSLGYRGVVITDDLYQMKAITDLYGREQAAVLAINAGVDILLYVSNTMSTTDQSSLLRHLVDTIEAKVQSGVIAESRIDESYQRIQALKKLYLPTGVPSLASTDLPSRITLENYPNPFNPSTTIRYGLPERAHVSLTIYNTLGQRVTTLVNRDDGPGMHQVRFDGGNLASGVYFYRLEAGSFYETRKLVLAK